MCPLWVTTRWRQIVYYLVCTPTPQTRGVKHLLHIHPYLPLYPDNHITATKRQPLQAYCNVSEVISFSSLNKNFDLPDLVGMYLMTRKSLLHLAWTIFNIPFVDRVPHHTRLKHLHFARQVRLLQHEALHERLRAFWIRQIFNLYPIDNEWWSWFLKWRYCSLSYVNNSLGFPITSFKSPVISSSPRQGMLS